MTGYGVRALREEECDTIAGWRYDGRYSTYEFDGERPDGDNGYHAVVDAGDHLIGFCCFGAEARVPGVMDEPGVVDVGYGMQPDLMGQGRGRPFVDAILAFALEELEPERFRALVLDWNRRSRRACENAGFEVTGAITNDSGTFMILERKP